MRADPRVEKVDIAGPGFINLTLKPHVWGEALLAALTQGRDYGRSDMGQGEKVNVEYVSANPTGPMHVGHCRGAVFGDALASLLEFAGYDVTREYYINDAGAQVDVLARSAYLRYREALGEDIGAIPEGLYPGDYLKEVGGELAADYGPELTTMPEAEWLPIVRERAINVIMADIRNDLMRLNVVPDVFYLRALADRGRGARSVRAGARRPTGRRMWSPKRSKPCAPKAWSMKAACRRPKAARSRTGRTASRPCSAPPSSATTSTGRC